MAPGSAVSVRPCGRPHPGQTPGRRLRQHEHLPEAGTAAALGRPSNPLPRGLCLLLRAVTPPVLLLEQEHRPCLEPRAGLTLPVAWHVALGSLCVLWQLSLDKELIDFGSYVVGETTSRTITLTNVGGLGTSFKILPASEPCEVDNSHSILKLSSLLIYEEKSVYDKAATSISEQPLEGNEFSQVDLQSRRAAEKLDQLQGEAEPEEAERLTTTIPPSEEQTEITLGEITQGDIGPFSSIRVPIIFTPMVPGDIQARFKVTFKNHQCPTLHFRVMGMAIDVPVWVSRPSVDLKICMYDRLYQDSVLVHTRSKAALRLRFEVCTELRAHLELLPETGYIQAQSSYSVQLKFLPR
ncbi:cilia- and flagella-associated protein 74-like [Sapajus apella]|uniref:Cilia- and flagella-associated protein 74-like n=1 Tax=Sapajus apella TaxID=9515 RepID=A0A6J3GIS2_SAPAP|nr:cilia- and flagella-associated protein 74-like [Sapajus apella]